MSELKEVKYPTQFGCYYDKDDVDTIIAEKDKEVAELKATLEDVKATAYVESVDAGMRERRLKRALWLLNANVFKWKALYFWYGYTDKPKSRRYSTAEDKCRSMAEKFK